MLSVTSYFVHCIALADIVATLILQWQIPNVYIVAVVRQHYTSKQKQPLLQQLHKL